MKNSLIVFCLLLLSTSVMAISSDKTNIDVMDNGKSLYGELTTGRDKQLIGVNSSDKVEIDADAIGTTITGKLAIPSFLSLTGSTTCSPSATASGNITPVCTNQIIAGFGAISTVNSILATNAVNGSIVILRTNASDKDVVLTEAVGGNMTLGAATRTLSNVADRIMLIYNSTSLKWNELFFADND